MENKEQKEEEWGTGPEAIEIAKQKAAEAAKRFKTGGTMSTPEAATKMLKELIVLECPSGVIYGLKRPSDKALAIIFQGLGTDTESFGSNSMAMLGNLDKYRDMIFDHIVSPALDKEIIPGSDWAHILTYMIFNVSGGEEMEDDLQSFRDK